MARGTLADSTRHARRRGRAARAHLRHKWRTGRGNVARATRVHANAREGRHVRTAGNWRAHVLVGPGKMIGVVMQ